MLEFKNIRKSFDGVEVLRGVSFSIREGKVTALMGENGAGKSTLMKILCGVIPDYEGEISLHDRVLNFKSVKDAEREAIAMIHQELNLVPHLSIGENIFLGKEPVNRFGFINFKKIHDQSNLLLKDFDFPYSSRTSIENIGLGWQQLVEIVKAMSNQSQLLILDEPTSSLTENEKNILFKKIRYLRELGKTFIYISHRMSEIFEIADDVVVMRDGEKVDQAPISSITRNEIIESMIGKRISEDLPARPENRAVPILKIKDLAVSKKGDCILKNISFEIKTGEVVGVAGLLGSGRTSLLKFLYGALDDVKFSGEVVYDGSPYSPLTIPGAQDRGIIYLSEDRKTEGIFPLLNLRINTSAAVLKNISKIGFVNGQLELAASTSKLGELNTKYASIAQLIVQLSGGNQQKVLLSRLMLLGPKLVLLDEPTRGIDVGAKEEIYKLIHKLSGEGITFLISSSEIPELKKVCDKIVVLSAGEQSAFIVPLETDTTEILKHAFVNV
jgi:ribose transport system ATP-binding protein